MNINSKLQSSEVSGQWKGIIKTLDSIINFANLSSAAYQSRLDGRIDYALSLEEQAEKIYKSLPKWAKW